jgi:transcriptional regulator with XRE-family HTH domain
MQKIKPCGLRQLVALNITELRKKKSILQKDLATQIGMKAKDLSLIENGQVDLQLSTLEKIAIVLKVPVEIFLSPVKNNEGQDTLFIDKAKLLGTIDKTKVDYVLGLLDIFIDNKLEHA